MPQTAWIDNKIDFEKHAAAIMRRCEVIALQTETDGMISRSFCTSAMVDAHRELRSWMQSIGLTCHLDPAGNLIGRTSCSTELPRLLVGSHIDTVPNGGRYDGALGIIMGLALAEAVSSFADQLPFAIEVVAFSEEEGVRFRSPYIGSRAMAGCFDCQLLERRDDSGETFSEVLAQFGGQPENLSDAKLEPASIIAFLEPHIEQGPVLESLDLPVGVVTGIAGQTRVTARFVGRAAHAGTTPMYLRADALAAAAEWISAVELMATQRSGLLATIGHLIVKPNVPNVVPGEVALRLDARHLDDAVRAVAVNDLKSLAESIADRRGLHFCWELGEEQPAAPTDIRMTQLLAAAVSDVGTAVHRLPSGAGHDAVIMSRIVPTTMLFLRCKGGISHHPDESVDQDDVEIALRVMVQFVKRLAETMEFKKV